MVPMQHVSPPSHHPQLFLALLTVCTVISIYFLYGQRSVSVYTNNLIKALFRAPHTLALLAAHGPQPLTEISTRVVSWG